MATDLRARFLWFIKHKRLVRADERVLVAVSGGVDSMVLLHLFESCAADLQIGIAAAHFDHAMRPGSAEDAQFVAEVCAEWRVPLIAGRATDQLHSEAAARTARYAFLMDAMKQAHAGRIATAHHADDQIETILFRLMRGAGLRGLSGIPVRRGVVIRPLLRFRKRALEAYAQEHHIDFREDETNTTARYARNRIRHVLIPAMQAARPETPSEILRMGRHAARAERAWRARIREARERAVLVRKTGATELAREIVREYDAETRARVLRAELQRFGVVPDRATTDRMVQFSEEAGSGARCEIGGGVSLERAFDVLRITRALMPENDQPATIESCAKGVVDAVIGGNRWRVSWTTSPGAASDAQRFDCAALRFPLEVRSWRPGDRIRMAYGTKKLKKLLAEARIPFHERAAVPIVADADGRVCWVVGVVRSVDAPAEQGDSAITIRVRHVEIS